MLTNNKKERKASTSNPNPFGDTLLNSKRGDEQFGTGSHGNATGAQGGLLPLWPLASLPRGVLNPTRLRTTPPAEGMGEGRWRRMAKLPPPPPTEPLLAPPAPGPMVPRPGLRPCHPSPHPRTGAHPRETARLAPFQAPRWATPRTRAGGGS